MDIKRRAAALRLQVEKERTEADGRVRFTSQLRADVVGFMKTSGMSRAAASRALSLAESLLQRWSTLDSSVKRKSSKLRRVKIVDTPPASDVGVAVVFPSGALM